MLGMGPILWEIAWRKTYPKGVGPIPLVPTPRRWAHHYRASTLYYKMLDRANLNLPIL